MKRLAHQPRQTKAAGLNRGKLISQVHIGTGRLFGRDDKAAHERYLMERTGRTSCEHLSDLELQAVVNDLRRAGALDGDGRGRGGKGADRPTKAQWAKLGALARAMGWKGLESKELQGFIQRTAKVTNSRFLTRDKATACITGLEQWVAERNAREGAA
jgi:phage gp16-like protein